MRCGERLFNATVVCQRIVRVAAIALEECAGFHREGFMQDVALDMACRLKREETLRARMLLPLTRPRTVTSSAITIRLHDKGLVADHKAGGIDVALHLSIDLNVFAAGCQSAIDYEVGR